MWIKGFLQLFSPLNLPVSFNKEKAKRKSRISLTEKLILKFKIIGYDLHLIAATVELWWRNSVLQQNELRDTDSL